MGRLLDMARTVPAVKETRPPAAVKPIKQLDHTAYRTERSSADAPLVKTEYAKSAVSPAGYSQAAADVLSILVRAGQPVLHSQIVRALMERGHSKQAAKDAIGKYQGAGWIEHDLVDGYILAGSREEQ